MKVMNKKQLIETLQRILSTDIDISFLLQLKENDLESLLACVRDRVGQTKG